MRAENKGLRCLVVVVSEFLQKTTLVGIATSKLTVSGHDGDGSNRSPFRRLASGTSIAEARPWLPLGRRSTTSAARIVRLVAYASGSTTISHRSQASKY